MQPLFVADRPGIEQAAALLAAFGSGAGREAAMRAERSRDIGNVIHFCRWRQVERLILALSLEEAVGILH